MITANILVYNKVVIFYVPDFQKSVVVCFLVWVPIHHCGPSLLPLSRLAVIKKEFQLKYDCLLQFNLLSNDSFKCIHLLKECAQQKRHLRWHVIVIFY